MKKSTLFAALSAAAICVLVWACSKPKIQANDSAYLKKLSLSVPFTCDVPANEGGTLVFADAQQYECYYQFVSDLMDRKDEDTTDINDVLDSLENSLGYTSLRHQKLAEFEAQNVIGWATYQEIPQEDWIQSIILRSILNTNREVKIGTDYHKYLSSEWMVSVDAGHSEVLGDLTALGNNPSLEEIFSLDPTRDFISIASLNDPERVFGSIKFADGNGIWGTPRISQKPTGTWTLSGTVHAKYHCTDYINTITFEGFMASSDGAPNKCLYRVYWNDGTNTYSDYTSTQGVNQSLVPSFDHLYSEGDWTPHVKVYAISPVNSGTTIVAERDFPIHVSSPGSICTADMHEKQTDYQINANYVIRGYVQYHTWFNFLPWNGPKSEYNGWTQLHEFKNGNWNRRKNKNTHLCVNLEADLRQEAPGNACSYVPNAPPSVYKCTTNSNQLYAEKEVGGIKKFRIVKARHEVSINGGISGYFEQEITACD